MDIRSVAVIGSGIMGMGIAAHLANAGIPSILLDLAQDGPGKPRDAPARAAVERALAGKPAAFYTPRAARLITTGTIEDDLPKLAGVDWIIEAVVERLEVKRALFARLVDIVGPESIVSSNTSGLTARAMLEGLPETFRRRFLITHFFNPVRYMKLLEIIPGPGSDPALVEAMVHFGSARLGKGVVVGNDTPNFIANRIGIYGFMAAMQRMVNEGYTIDEVDTILGPAIGRPKSAVFRTADLSGLDTILHVARNLYEAAPEDECRDVFIVPDFLPRVVDRGWLGEKSGQGFYKRVKQVGETQILSLDLKSMEYRPRERLQFTSLEQTKNVAETGERIRQIVNAADRAARFAWEMIADTLCYAANRMTAERGQPIADRIEAVDQAMRWGFNWDLGPFQTWDALGVSQVVDRLQAEGRPVPLLAQRVLAAGGWFYQGKAPSRAAYVPRAQRYEAAIEPEGALTLAQVLEERGPAAVLRSNKGGALIDLGDGIACLTFRTKLNSIDADVIALLTEVMRDAAGHYRGLVIGTDEADFSAGANLVVILMAARMRQWKNLDAGVRALQDAHMALKYSPIPVVVAAAGRTLAGGCETMLHATRVRAHAELYCGLVEAGAGLVPAGGGCKELLLRHGAASGKGGPFPAVRAAFETIALAKVSTSAEEARDLRFLRRDDPVSLDRERLLADAKADAIALAESGYTPPAPSELLLPGEGGRLVLEQQIDGFRQTGSISDHDVVVATKLAYVLTGGSASPVQRVPEQHVLDLEREVFLSLCGMARTQERMAALLQTGKPLRN
jgi:3-hydroxyacyl-CoA dehydrogenase